MNIVAGDTGTGHRTWLRLSHPAEPGELRTIRGRVADWGRRHEMPEDALIDLQLAIGEAVSNGIEHAYLDGRAGRARTVEVDLELQVTRTGRVVLVQVTDHGRWRPAPAESGYRGRGMALIAQLSRNLRVDRTPWGTQVRFEIMTGRLGRGDSQGGASAEVR